MVSSFSRDCSQEPSHVIAKRLLFSFCSSPRGLLLASMQSSAFGVKSHLCWTVRMVTLVYWLMTWPPKALLNLIACFHRKYWGVPHWVCAYELAIHFWAFVFGLVKAHPDRQPVFFCDWPSNIFFLALCLSTVFCLFVYPSGYSSVRPACAG